MGDLTIGPPDAVPQPLHLIWPSPHIPVAIEFLSLALVVLVILAIWMGVEWSVGDK